MEEQILQKEINSPEIEKKMEENKKSQQEKEWEIPAFLRKVKIK